MERKLKIVVKEINCYDPQDPRYDELYFVTATNKKSNVSKTLRKINELGPIFPNLVIFEDKVDENSPILITGVEQRGLKDDGAATRMMEQLAQQGLDFADKWIEKTMSVPTGIWNKVADFLLNNLIGIVKLIFKDSPLLNKVITEPYVKDVDYPIKYKLEVKHDKRPTYHYKILIEVDYK